MQALKLLRPLTENPRREFAGIDLIRKSGLATGTAYPIMLRLERQGLVTSKWEEGDPAELGRPRRRYYKITRAGAAAARQAVAQITATNAVAALLPTLYTSAL